MSVKVSKAVWEKSGAEDTELLLLLAIADFVNEDKGYAWPSVGTLAKKIRKSERQVQRMLKSLEASGELRIQRAAGPNGVNTYAVTLPEQACHPDTTASPLPDIVLSPPPRHSSVTPPVTYVSPKPLEEPLQEPLGEPNLFTREERERALDQSFEAFYRRYPRKDGKADARKAWPKALKDCGDLDTMLDALQQFIDITWKDCEKKYIPYPAKWLRGERWRDPAPEPQDMPPRSTSTRQGMSANDLLAWANELEAQGL